MSNGRLTEDEMKHVVADTPSQSVAAILTKQDEILAKLNALLAAMDGAADGNALNTAIQGIDLSVLEAVDIK